MNRTPLIPAEAGAQGFPEGCDGSDWACRGRGVGRALASALMQEGLARSPSLTVHAVRPASRAFWEAMGFRPDDRNGWSHRYGP